MTGQFTTLNANLTGFAREIGEGIWRIELRFNVTAAPTGSRLYMQLVTEPVSRIGAFGIFAAPQLERGLGATSPILTGAGPVTRAADVASADIAHLSGPVTMFIEGAPGHRNLSAAGDMIESTGVNISAASGTNNARLWVDNSPTYTFQAETFRPGNQSNQSIAASEGAPVKAAMALDDTQFSFAVDGALVGSAANTLTSMDWEVLNIGHFAGPTRWWNGTIKRVLFYPSRLTDARLQEITA